MIYQPFLISNYATGLARAVQPWLLPNDAFVDLLDGFVYRGVTKKRDGYSGFAIGLKSTYTESIADDAVTFVKMQDISLGQILGRYSSGTGDVKY